MPGRNGGEPDFSLYADMLDMPPFEPKRHPRMDAGARAAQFAPFAALTGYHAAIEETARLTEDAPGEDEDRQAALDSKLSRLMGLIGTRPQVTVSRFTQDARKAGGAYGTVTGRLKRIDTYEKALYLEDGEMIPFRYILDIEPADCSGTGI